jgi:hypothetical protein
MLASCPELRGIGSDLPGWPVLVVTDESFSLVKIVWIKSSRNRALVAVYF